MSVTISEYCLQNDNKLVQCLKRALDDGVFLSSTLIVVVQTQGEWWCHIYMDYTLSCNDFDAIKETFDHYWWCVSPYGFGSPYSVSINLKRDL